MNTGLHKRHRFPVEELMLERGIKLSYETVRRRCLKFGGEYARRLKRHRVQPGDKWHVDEVFLSINGERRYLWRAVDQEGNTLDILMTSKRDKRAAERFFRKLLRSMLNRGWLLLTNYAATEPLLKSCCPGLNTARVVT